MPLRRLLLNQPLPLPPLHRQQQTYRIYSTTRSDDNLEEALPEAVHLEEDRQEEYHLEDRCPLVRSQMQRYSQ